MKIYVMRHGKTVWNEKQITQGQTNNRLSKNGKIKTQEVAQKYADTSFDVIFCSPLMRTMQTANIMNAFHGIKIIKDARLIEIDQGIFTGRSKNSLTDEEKKHKLSRDKKYGLETYQSVQKRTKNFIEDLKKLQYKSVLIITHNVSASFIEEIVTNKNNDTNCENRHFDNSEIKCFDLQT